MLPNRTSEAEDTFVAQMGGAPNTEIIDCAVLAVDAARPVLAARLVGLLPPDVDFDEHPQLARAQRAAKLVLLAPVDRRGPVIAAFEVALSAMKGRHMHRAKARLRRVAAGESKGAGPRRKPRRIRD
jgi:hypothetical protein